MADYIIDNTFAGSQQNLSSSYKTIFNLLAGATPRVGYLYDVFFGVDGTPADNAIIYAIYRQTADDGTKTNATPNLINPADAAYSGLARVNFSGEGTIGTQVFPALALNQRSTFEWVPAPESELVYPATSNNGLAVRAKSPAYTSTVICGAYVSD